MSSSRRFLIVIALGILVVLCAFRYEDRFHASDYVRGAQMVLLVWVGFFIASRYSIRSGDARFGRQLDIVASILCIPLLAFHVLDGTGTAFIGNLVLLAGIGSYTFGAWLSHLRSDQATRRGP